VDLGGRLPGRELPGARRAAHVLALGVVRLLTLRRLHRYIGLSLLALWLVQAGTGVLMVFHWELGDALIAGRAAPTDWVALERRIAQLGAAHSGDQVSSVYPTAGARDRYDFYVGESSGLSRTVRTNGAGEVLAMWSSGGEGAHRPLIEAAVELHQSLFAGHAGRLLLGASGLFLLGNLVIGLKLAWPAVGTWLRALRPPARGPALARLYGWHRALGLWLAVPALVIVSAGILQAFDDTVEGLLGTELPGPTFAATAAPVAVGPAQAVAIALANFPGATFAGMTMPGDARPWYRIRVRQPGELRRVYGTTTVYVATADGAIDVANDARSAPWKKRFLDATWPLHTGEAAGLGGRVLALATALCILGSIVLGGLLWWRRRSFAQRLAGGPRP
jgi:uncharacterized iron-regulated membrane protein